MESDIRQRLEEDRYVEERSLVCPFPRKMLLEATNACNDSCLFCANSKSSRKRGMIDGRLAKRILKEAYDLGTREVGFYATGEPLLNEDLEAYVAFAKEIGYGYVYITTNGALLTPERAERLIGAGIDSVKFSINASDARMYHLIHGNDDLDRVTDNLIWFDRLRKEQERKIALYVSFIRTRFTKDDQEIFMDRFGKYVDDIVFMDCHNLAGCMTKEIKGYLSVDGHTCYTPPEGICPMVFKTLHVTYEGYLTMCCTDFQDYLAVADLGQESLADAWNNSHAQALRKRHLEQDLEGTMCYNCMNDCCEHIEPLRHDLAVHYDSRDWSKEEQIERRIGSFR